MSGMRINYDKILQEFVHNTGADREWALDVLNRNKWDLPRSYREVEQMCSYRSQTFPKSQSGSGRQTGLSQQIKMDSESGGMVGGVGPATNFDPWVIRSQASQYPAPPCCHSQEMTGSGLRVALPPVQAPIERVIPVQIMGKANYQPESTIRNNLNPEQVAMARLTLDEKVLTNKPQVMPPAMVTPNISQQQSTSQPTVDQSPAPNQAGSVANVESNPKLKRGFSNILENASLVNKARSHVLHNIEEDKHGIFFESFVLPDLTVHPEDFRAYLERYLIETSTLISLEQAGRLNWWAEAGLCQRLLPMATSGDGNCLLHAASLAMWGIHDRQLILRKELHRMLTELPIKECLYRRWRWQQTQVNKQSGLVYSESEWKAEWENVLRLASPSPRNSRCLPESSRNENCYDSSFISSSSTIKSEPVVYESLEEFHVFVLAHVLRRPIIIVADTVLKDANGEDLAPIPFGGIYLPLECKASMCYHFPLLLTYDAAHFSALLPMQHNNSNSYSKTLPLAIPVVDPELKLLPTHFSYDPGPNFDWLHPIPAAAQPCTEDCLNIIRQYLQLEQLPMLLFCNAPSEHSTSSSGPPSRQSSGGSEDSGVFAVPVKDKKKEGKQSVVTKQFGSLGRSVGKKLKNLAPSKGGSKLGNGEHDKQQSSKSSTSLSSGLTQSTKVMTMLASTAGREELVWCAHLCDQQSDAQELMAANYIQDVFKQFSRDKEQKRLKGEELMSRVNSDPTSTLSRPRSCATPGCHMSSLPENNYLCLKCSSQQPWHGSQDLEDRGQFAYNTFPYRGKVAPGLPASSGVSSSSDQIYCFSKSKFYTSPAHSNNRQLLPLKMDRMQSLSAGNIAAARYTRSPSPDYDNAASTAHQGSLSVVLNKSAAKCLNPDCEFFGSAETKLLCSRCYKNEQQPYLTKAENTAKL